MSNAPIFLLASESCSTSRTMIHAIIPAQEAIHQETGLYLNFHNTRLTDIPLVSHITGEHATTAEQRKHQGIQIGNKTPSSPEGE